MGCGNFGVGGSSCSGFIGGLGWWGRPKWTQLKWTPEVGDVNYHQLKNE